MYSLFEKPSPANRLFIDFCTYLESKQYVSRELLNAKLDTLLEHSWGMDDEYINVMLENLFILAIQKRAVRLEYGQKSKDIFYWMIIRLHELFPNTVENLLPEIPSIGYWRDLNNIYRICWNDQVYTPLTFVAARRTRLRESIIQVWARALKKDIILLEQGEPVSLLGKWIPKEKRSLDKLTHVVRILALRIFNNNFRFNSKQCLKLYRTAVSKCNRSLRTTETLMCTNSFSDIDFYCVPFRCLNKYHNTWSARDKFGRLLHFPNKPEKQWDRAAARENYMNFLNIRNTDTLEAVEHTTSCIDKLYSSDYFHFRLIIRRTREIFE